MKFHGLRFIKNFALTSLIGGLYTIIPLTSCSPDLEEAKKKSVFAQRQEKLLNLSDIEEKPYEVQQDSISYSRDFVELQQEKPQIVKEEIQKPSKETVSAVSLEELVQTQETTSVELSEQLSELTNPYIDNKNDIVDFLGDEGIFNMDSVSTIWSNFDPEKIKVKEMAFPGIIVENEPISTGFDFNMEDCSIMNYQPAPLKVTNKLSTNNPTPSHLALKALKENGFTKIIGAKNLSWILYGGNGYEGFINLNIGQLENITNLPLGKEFTWDFRLLPLTYQGLLEPCRTLSYKSYTVQPIEKGGIENGTLGGLVYKYLRENSIPLGNNEVYDGLSELIGNMNIELGNINNKKMLYPGQKIEFFPFEIGRYIENLQMKNAQTSYNLDLERGWNIQYGNNVYKQDKSGRWRVKNMGANAPGVYISKSKLLDLGLI